MNPKKRMMFIASEDYYYITYSILLILQYLESYNGNNIQDRRILNVLIETTSNSRLLTVLERSKLLHQLPQGSDISVLENSYDRIQSRTAFVNRVLFVLNHHNYVELLDDYGIALVNQNIPDGFYDEKLFELEISNILRIKKLYPQIKRTKTERLIENLFTKNGVLV